jgi:hypothetical protein
MATIKGKFVILSANGLVVTTIEDVTMTRTGQVTFKRVNDTHGLGNIADQDGSVDEMPDHDLLQCFLEGRAFRLGDV